MTKLERVVQVTSAAVFAPPATPFWSARSVAAGALTLLLADGSEVPLALRTSYSIETLQHMGALISEYALAKHPTQDEETLSLLADVDVQPSFEQDGATALVEAQAALLRRLGAADGAADLAALPQTITRRVQTTAYGRGSLTVEVAPEAPRAAMMHRPLCVLALGALLAVAMLAAGLGTLTIVSLCTGHRLGSSTGATMDCLVSEVTFGAIGPKWWSSNMPEVLEALDKPSRDILQAKIREIEEARRRLSKPGSAAAMIEAIATMRRVTLISAAVLAASVVALCALLVWRQPRRARLVIDSRCGEWRLDVWRSAWAWLHRVPGTAATFRGGIHDLQGCVVCSASLLASSCANQPL